MYLEVSIAFKSILEKKLFSWKKNCPNCHHFSRTMNIQIIKNYWDMEIIGNRRKKNYFTKILKQKPLQCDENYYKNCLTTAWPLHCLTIVWRLRCDLKLEGKKSMVKNFLLTNSRLITLSQHTIWSWVRIQRMKMSLI